MKILKESEKYLDEKIKSNKMKAIIFLSLGLLALVLTLITFVFFPVGIILIIISIYYFSVSINYKKGKLGELLTKEFLKMLNDDYYLINDIRLPHTNSNIDHIILGPNGIFIIETKNYTGKIICHGDKWYKYYEGGLTISMRGHPYWKPSREYEISSLTKQIKRNAIKLKELIQRKLKKSIWVEGIVVFTSSDVELELNHPTVHILKVDELPSFIKSKKSKIKFSPDELKLVGKLILKYSKIQY